MALVARISSVCAPLRLETQLFTQITIVPNHNQAGKVLRFTTASGAKTATVRRHCVAITTAIRHWWPAASSGACAPLNRRSQCVIGSQHHTHMIAHAPTMTKRA